MNELEEAALEYAALGWPIFPVRKNKKPYTDNGVLEATTNKKQIKKWWKKWPRANIALHVGEANMMVVDFDPGHDLKELKENVGKLPKTKLAATTPRGGRHLYFSLDEGETIPPSTSKLASHVDVRSFHSYVLLAPSETNEGAYEWDADPRDDDRLQAAYRSDLLAEKAGEVKAKSEDRDNWIIEADLDENIALASAWLAKEARVSIQGAGGDHTAYSTAAMCKSYGLSPETALELMMEHWVPRCIPPNWDWDRLDINVTHAYEYNTSPPGNMTPAYTVAKSKDLFKPVARDTGDGGGEITAGRFRIVNRKGMNEIKPAKWLIEGMIPQFSYSLLIGPRSTLKTFVALDMALSVATGAPFEDWRGPWPSIIKPGPVLFAAGEGRSNMVDRVAAWEKVHMEGEETEKFYLADPVPSPNAEDVTPFIESALKWEDEFSLVVLDTVGRSMQGLNENSQQDASMFTRVVETIQHELNCAVLAIHHSGHDNATRGRGSSVFGADVDAEFVLERNEKDKTVLINNTKQKDAPEWEEPKVIEFKEVKLGKRTSLAALEPSEKQKKTATTKQKQKGRKTKKDMALSIELVSREAFEFLRDTPHKLYSDTELAKGIGASGSIPMSVTTIRQNYIPKMLIDKEHPVFECFDAVESKWVYRKKH